MSKRKSTTNKPQKSRKVEYDEEDISSSEVEEDENDEDTNADDDLSSIPELPAPEVIFYIIYLQRSFIWIFHIIF